MRAESLGGDGPFPEDEVVIERLKQMMADGELSLEEAIDEFYRHADARHYGKGE